ncbi:sialate O-acetylesterase [Hephaestia caeni]|nr:sialate O-acetylesterase [Hephaestia caeni]
MSTHWAIALACLAASPAFASPTLDGIVGDHAVLQRGEPIVLAGAAAPGEEITISLAGETVTTTADGRGRFAATLGALPAGGPYDLIVAAKSGLVTVRDVLIGDVYLCSGQSNMEMSVERSQNSGQALGAADDKLRLLTVGKATALTPQAAFATKPAWTAAAPESVAPFSAACFYMVQALRETSKVPIGAIHASWGGSRISAWLTPEGLREAGMGKELETLRLYAHDTTAATAAASKAWEQWWRGHSGDAVGHEPWQTNTAIDWKPVPRIAPFNDWGVPELVDYIGMVWFRKDVTVSAAQARQQAVLAIGPVDDADRTWVNGVAVGGNGNPGEPRTYFVPAGTLVAGANTITVNADNVYAKGGMSGPAAAMRLLFADGSIVPLGKGWRYAIGGRPMTNTPRSPWDAINGAGTLYNAMIAPLGPIGLAGVAWYQGESDTGLPGYGDRLRALMQGWRHQAGRPALPFAIAQISAYGATAAHPVESDWAKLRDIQRQAAEADGHVAIAVTIDLGDPLDIHPGEKHEVGQRLARAMRALALGDGDAPSGPRVTTAHRAPDGNVILGFTDVTGALEARGSDRPIGFELCGNIPGSCRYATASLTAAHVTLAADGRPATRVRYAWADSPTINLFDKAGLPAGPFEVAIQ